MLRHIVMFKLSDRSTKDEVSSKIKNMLEKLVDDIPELKRMEVGLNMSTKPSAFDVVLTADFDDESGLDAYRVHQKHQEVLDYLKGVMEKAAVVDYNLILEFIITH